LAKKGITEPRQFDFINEQVLFERYERIYDINKIREALTFINSSPVFVKKECNGGTTGYYPVIYSISE
jgi:hypothetical protein